MSVRGSKHKRSLIRPDATLLRTVEICKLGQPSNHNLHILRQWLRAFDRGDYFLEGTEARIWEPQNEEDLTALSHKPSEQGPISAWLAEKLITYLHQTCWYRTKVTRPPQHRVSSCKADVVQKPLPGDVESGLADYKESRILAAANVVSTMLAAMLPTVCIFVLYFVKRPLARLGVIMAFSATFSITLAIFTRARQVEIFAATAA